MSDARALLRAKRQEARITHPYATYSSSGQLRCTVCATIVKQASMWEGHIGSKAHRVAVTKLREKEAKEEEERRMVEKRKAEEDAEGMNVSTKKMRLGEEADEDEEVAKHFKRAQGSANGGFPADFFSDPSRTLPLWDDEEEEEEETVNSSTAAPVSKEKSQIDLEWEQFQAAMLQNANTAENEKEEERRDAYDRATVFAEPQLAPGATAGFPPAIAGGDVDGEVPGDIEEEHREETEEEKRKRKEQEERELIMDRLLEEERAQEEADSRVSMMMSKLQALKKARSERRKVDKKS